MNKINIVKPTPELAEWADYELGIIVHYGMTSYAGVYNADVYSKDPPSPSIFNPESLDTDQWVRIAKDAGIKYMILVAQHGTGFALWPTKAHDYSIKNSPYKDGNGNIVADFIKSCKKYDIHPGIYCHCSVNSYFDVVHPGKVKNGDPEAQKKYNEVVIKQLTELWSDYGKLFEIWFDGGLLPVEKGGPDVPSLLNKLQPDVIAFQGPPSTKSVLRWVGNEDGNAPDNCWSTIGEIDHQNLPDGIDVRCGNPFGDIWMPAECDMTIRDNKKAYSGGWDWIDSTQDNLVYSPEYLLKQYYNSVGRNCNQLIGMVIDRDGRVPAADEKTFIEFGKLLSKTFGNPIAQYISDTECENIIELDINSKCKIGNIVLQENIEKNGESVLEYSVEGFNGLDWVEIASAQCIGHKRIHKIEPALFDKIRFVCKKSKNSIYIRNFSVFE